MAIESPKRPAFFSVAQTDWRREIVGRPLLFALFAFTLGILLVQSVWGLFAGLAAAISVSVAISRAWIPAAIVFGFFGLGAARMAVSSAPATADISRFIGAGHVLVSGSLSSDPESSRFSTTGILRASRITMADGADYPIEGLLLLRFPLESGVLEYGEWLEVRGAIQRPQAADNPGLFRHPEYLARMGVYAYLHVRRAESVRRIGGSRGPIDQLAAWMQRARESLISIMDRNLQPLEANLLAGIVLGQRTRLPAEVKDDFTATGTTHILASSGMNVGIVAVFTFGVARLVRIRRTRAVGLVLVAMLLYSLLAGAKPSVIRADIMASCFLLSAVFDREADVISSLALAALMLLMLNPYSLLDPGFQLSFAAVIGLLGFSPMIVRYVSHARDEGVTPRYPGRLWRLAFAGFVVSLVAQLSTLPLTAQHFNQISLVGILANALIVAVIPLLLFGGLALWLVGLLLPSAAPILAWLLSFPLAYVLGVADSFGSVPFAVINVPSPGWAFVSLYYLMGSYLAWLLRLRQESSV